MTSPWLPHRLNPDPTNPYDDEHYNPDRPRISWEPEDYHQEPIPDVRWPRGQKPTNLWRGLHIDLDHPQWADHPNVQGMKRILYGEQDTGGGLYAPSPSQGNLHPHPASPEGKALSQHILDFAEDVGQNVDTYREPWTEENDATRVPFTKIHDKSDPTWLGRHWTTDPDVADSYAYKTTPGRRGLSVLMRARWDGRGEDLSRANAGGSWPDENEINLLPGTQLDIHGLGIRHPDSVHNMYNSQYHNLLKGQDHERRTAGVEPFQMRMEHLDPHLVYDREREFSDDPWSGWRKRTVPLVEDVKRNGIGMPVTMATDGHLGILEDGNHRAAAAKILGLPTVPVRFQRANTRYLSRGGGVPLHPSVQQHLADHPEALLDHVERQPSWAQGERTAAWDDKLPKEQKCKYCAQQASKRIQHSEGMAYVPVCDKHLEKGKDAAARCTPGGEHDPSNINAIKDVRQARQAFRLIAAFDIEAMAAEDWEVRGQPLEPIDDNLSEGYYSAHSKVDGGKVGELQCSSNWPGHLYIDSIITHPDVRGGGVARAMLTQMVKDHPRHKIDPGRTTELGEAMRQHMQGKHPNISVLKGQSDRAEDFDPHYHLKWRTGALEFQRGDIHPDYGPDPEHAISAHLDGEPVGRMLWYPDGELTQIEVHPDHRRQGIGTQMFNWAKRNVAPHLHHSPSMTSEGRDWAASMGYAPEDYDHVATAEDAMWRTRNAFRLTAAFDREAMPAPLPEGLTFHHKPSRYLDESEYSYMEPSLSAHLNGEQVGRIRWHDRDDLRDYAPGEVSGITVAEPHRRSGIATELFDRAKEIEPRLHHSPQRSPLGRQWIEYEESRNRQAFRLTAAFKVSA